MKGMKGRLLKKLKSIRPISSPKQSRVLQVKASDGYLDPLPPDSNVVLSNSPVSKEQDPTINHSNLPVQELDIVDVSELMKDLEEEEMEFIDVVGNKENIGPPTKDNSENPIFSESRNLRQGPLTEINVSMNMNSGNIFDQKEVILSKSRRVENINPLLEFEEKCPPGGSECVILYSTSLRGVRKTFEDCESIRFLLGSFGIVFYERDVSMHLEFREELWRILGGSVVLPRLFIKGRYIGGASEVLELHEQGKMLQLFEGIPLDQSNGPCDGCSGIRFVLCFNCNGSRKVSPDEGDEYDSLSLQCPECNENGLIICPICC